LAKTAPGSSERIAQFSKSRRSNGSVKTETELPDVTLIPLRIRGAGHPRFEASSLAQVSQPSSLGRLEHDQTFSVLRDIPIRPFKALATGLSTSGIDQGVAVPPILIVKRSSPTRVGN
jgi:hypothetical protein